MSLVMVDVPVGREADFHAMYAAWLTEAQRAQVSAGGPEPVASHWDPEDPADIELAAVLWRRMTQSAKEVTWRLIAGSAGMAPTRHDGGWTGTELAEAVGLANQSAVAGTFSWPGVYCKQHNKHYFWTWSIDGATGEKIYGMDEAVGGVFLKALRVMEDIGIDSARGTLSGPA